jgi:hypothetical protein
MKFFLRADDPKIAEQSYQTIKKFNEKQIGWPISDARYYEIRYSHNGQDLYARVGEPDPLNGETVIAIFKPKHAQSPFLVCTYIGSDARDMYVDRAVEGVEPLVLQEIHDRLARHDTPPHGGRAPARDQTDNRSSCMPRCRAARSPTAQSALAQNAPRRLWNAQNGAQPCQQLARLERLWF